MKYLLKPRVEALLSFAFFVLAFIARKDLVPASLWFAIAVMAGLYYFPFRFSVQLVHAVSGARSRVLYLVSSYAIGMVYAMSGVVLLIDQTGFFSHALSISSLVNSILLFFWFSSKETAWIGVTHFGVSLVASVILFV